MEIPVVDVSVVIPAFNEEVMLPGCVRGVVKTLVALKVSHEVLIVDDGSKDGTGAIADALAAELPVVKALHQENRGIGGAFQTGVAASHGRYVALWPADMPCTPEALLPFTSALSRGDVIVGCRRRRVGYNPMMKVNAWLYPRLVKSLFGLSLRDVNWICFYDGARLRRLRLTQSGIPMLAEILVRMRDDGASFHEVDVDMVDRASGVPSASRFKVMRRTLGGLFQFWDRWRREPRAAVPPAAGAGSPGSSKGAGKPAEKTARPASPIGRSKEDREKNRQTTGEIT
jgi:glycosyltransferase involved in cell wall biosynthesis